MGYIFPTHRSALFCILIRQTVMYDSIGPEKSISPLRFFELSEKYLRWNSALLQLKIREHDRVMPIRKSEGERNDSKTGTEKKEREWERKKQSIILEFNNDYRKKIENGN